MKRLLILLVLPLGLAGCAAVPQLALSAVSIAGNIAAANAIDKSAAQSTADRCYQVAKKAEQEKLGEAEKRRLFTAERCPL